MFQDFQVFEGVFGSFPLYIKLLWEKTPIFSFGWVKAVALLLCCAIVCTFFAGMKGPSGEPGSAGPEGDPGLIGPPGKSYFWS